LDIPEGYWGIYKETENMPLERFDPFRTIINEFGTKVGHITQFSPLRGKRPFEHKESNQIILEELHIERDSFCKVVAGELPAVVLSQDGNISNHPLSVEPKKENLENHTAISIVNLFTPMARVLYQHAQELDSIKDKSIGVGMVHLLTKHYDTLSDASKEEIIELLRTTQVAHRDSVDVLKEKYNTSKLTILHFFNIGEEAGASICHIHSQTYIYANDIGHGWTSLGFLSVPGFHKKKMNNHNYCLACKLVEDKKIKDPLNQELNFGERIVFENEEWILLTAFAPERDGQLRLIPKKHTSQFLNLDEEQIIKLAEAILVANKALDEFIALAPQSMNLLQDRNILFRQENIGYNSDMHLLIDIIPIQRIGGAEIMETYRIATMFPEDVAKIMRDCLNKK
jgi:UDPglucose--hexose-1-phosphate uridylyltransferase